MSVMSPQIGEFLIKAMHLPDIDAALKKVLTEYIELKTADIGGKIGKYESKWRMTFEEFQDACRNNKLKVDVYSYEVEKDFWGWEQLESLFQYYRDIKSKWI